MAFWIVVLIVAATLYFLAMIWFLPKAFLKSKYSFKATCDRGIKKYKLESEGYAIVYEPHLRARKYIKQYVITEKDGKKTLKCKIDEDTFYLDFDIFLFDSLHQVFDVIHVCDLIQEQGYTQDVEIPTEAAYVSLFLNRVNNEVLNKKPRVKQSVSKLAGLWIWSTVFTVVFAFTVKLCVANLIAGVFRQSVMLSLKGNVMTALVAVGIDVLCMVVLTFILKKKKK